MPKALITIQENQLSNKQIRKLDKMVKKHYKKHVSRKKLMTIWCCVPEGCAYTNYKESNSSLLTIECPDNFEQKKRVSMLLDCERDWLKVTGQHTDEVMLALVEKSMFLSIVSSNQDRLSLEGKLSMALHMLKAYLFSLFVRTPMTFSANI